MLALTSSVWGQGMGADLPVVDEAASIADKLGVSVPTDIPFKDTDGNTVTFADLMTGDRPIILNLGYFSCPGTCDAVTNTTLNALRLADMLPGAEVDVWTVSISPDEGLELAADKKANYLDRLELSQSARDEVSAHWRFLTSRDEGAARTVAEAVGWRYKWNEISGQYDHSNAIVVLSPDGVVTRYLSALTLNGRNLRPALVEAADGKIGSFIEQLYVSCLTWNAEAQGYSAAMFTMKVGGVLTLLLLGGMMLSLFLRETRRNPDQKAVAPV